MGLRIEAVQKRFGAVSALESVSLDVAKGAFLALLGPSGSGKTTLLRILAGLEFPEAGAVQFDGENLLALSARERRVGMVFQHYALFRHMTVADNIAFGLTVRPRKARPTAPEIKRRVDELLRLVQIEDLGARYPSQISGGQRQRVALARALAIEPRLLLLDEPFGALDAKVRKELRRWLRGVHERTGVTTVFVTHDQEEALDLAGHVAILRAGRIEQAGSPAEIYENPSTAFVADFIGGANRIEGDVRAGIFKAYGQSWPVSGMEDYTGPAAAYVRPHEFDVAHGARPDAMLVTIIQVLSAGPVIRLDARLMDGRTFDVSLPPGAKAPERGGELSIKPKVLRVFRGRNNAS